MKEIIFSLLFLVIVLWIVLPWNMTAIVLPADNVVNEIQKETWKRIFKSDVSNDYNELANWLGEYHGELYDQQVMSYLAEWSLVNKAGFKKVINLLSVNNKIANLELLGFVIHQSGQYEDFVKEYGDDSEEEVKVIVRKATEDKVNVGGYVKVVLWLVIKKFY